MCNRMKNKRLEPIPRFATEAEEREFWENHDSAVYMDWSQAKTNLLTNLKPTCSLDTALRNPGTVGNWRK